MFNRVRHFLAKALMAPVASMLFTLVQLMLMCISIIYAAIIILGFSIIYPYVYARNFTRNGFSAANEHALLVLIWGPVLSLSSAIVSMANLGLSPFIGFYHGFRRGVDSFYDLWRFLTKLLLPSEENYLAIVASCFIYLRFGMQRVLNYINPRNIRREVTRQPDSHVVIANDLGFVQSSPLVLLKLELPPQACPRLSEHEIQTLKTKEDGKIKSLFANYKQLIAILDEKEDLLTYESIFHPVLLIKQYHCPKKNNWQSIEGAIWKFERSSLEQAVRLRQRNPMTNEEIDSPSPFNNLVTRYIVHDFGKNYSGTLYSERLNQLITELRQTLTQASTNQPALSHLATNNNIRY